LLSFDGSRKRDWDSEWDLLLFRLLRRLRGAFELYGGFAGSHLASLLLLLLLLLLLRGFRVFALLLLLLLDGGFARGDLSGLLLLLLSRRLGVFALLWLLNWGLAGGNLSALLLLLLQTSEYPVESFCNLFTNQLYY